jgi:hypothetical protein
VGRASPERARGLIAEEEEVDRPQPEESFRPRVVERVPGSDGVVLAAITARRRPPGTWPNHRGHTLATSNE